MPDKAQNQTVTENEEHNMATEQNSSEPESTESTESTDDAIAGKFESLRAKLDDAKALADEHKDAALRATAELENFRRRSEQEVEKAHKFALDRFVKALLPVIDAMERAGEVESDSDAVQAMKEGVTLTEKMFIDTVAKFGVEQINPMGEAFNADFHEAMSMVPNPDMEPNMVMQVIQKGYLLNGRVVRPARVIVSQG